MMLNSRVTLVLATLFFGGAVIASVAAAQPLSDATLIDGLHRISESSIPDEMGVEVELLLTTSTRMTRREIDRRLGEIADYPDHPELRLLQRHLRLQADPEVTRTRIQYADRAAWKLDQTLHDGARFVRGGTSEERWMLFDAGDKARQLTLVGEGVPFPAQYNVSRYLDTVQQRLRMLNILGVYQLASDSSFEETQTRGSEWAARVLQDGESQLQVSGRWDETYGLPVIMRVSIVDADGRSIHQTLECSEHTYQPELNRFIPGRLQLDHRDGLREVWRVETFRVVPRHEVVAAATAPGVGDEVTVRDFRSPAASTSGEFANSNLAVWRTEGNRDTYELKERHVPGSGLNTRAPSTDANGPGRWFKYLAVMIAATAFLAVVFRRKWLHT